MIKMFFSRKNVVELIIPILTAIGGVFLAVYPEELRKILGSFYVFVNAVAILIATASMIVLLVVYIKRYIWKSSSDVQELKAELESVKSLLYMQTKTLATLNQVAVSYINALDNEGSKNIADILIASNVNIDDLEKLGLRSALVKLLKAKYHERELTMLNATISFNS